MISFNLKVKNLPVEAQYWTAYWAGSYKPTTAVALPGEALRFENVPATSEVKNTIWYFAGGGYRPDGYLPITTLEDGKTYTFDAITGVLNGQAKKPWAVLAVVGIFFLIFTRNRRR